MLLFGTLSLLALASIWGGYPVAVRVLGAMRNMDGTAHASDDAPRVSVIIASHHEAAAINARVDDVLRSRYPADRIEVIVALDAARSQATVRELQRADRRITILVGDAPGGKASALNAAARAAQHELLVFTDTAQRFDPDAIGELVAVFRDPRIGAVSGMLELGRSGRPVNLAERYWLYERWLRRWEARVHSSVGVTGAIYAMRRSVWEELPASLILDDLYGPMRLVLQGWRIGFAERARARDDRRFAAADEYQRKVRTLTGVIQVCAWLPRVLDPIRNPIWLQFVFHKLLRLVTPYLTLFVGIAAAWLIGSAIIASPVSWQILSVAAMALLLVCLIPRVRRAAGAQIAWGVALQSSVVVATINGVRGRWNVWQ